MAARAKSAALPWAAFRLGPPLCIGRAAGGLFLCGLCDDTARLFRPRWLNLCSAG